ncbi:MAG TPA: DUF4838 domain-containing protein [Chthoniobacteraceae bacterium]|nr:DUF4838 domain-containing protein [Chthoniobacteraceae bacterium]
MTARLAAGETFSITGDSRSPEEERALTLARDLFSRLGLIPAAEGRWRIDLGQRPPAAPGSYHLSFDAETTQWQVKAGDGEGTRLALMRLLHRLGVRWFDPSAPVSLPQLPLELESFREEHTPSFPYRGLHICAGSHHYDETLADWMSFQGMNRKLTHVGELAVVGEALVERGLAPDTTVHSYSDWISDAGYLASNPEFFSLLGGRRVRHKEGGQLCLSSEAMRAAFIGNLRAFMGEHPETAVLGICPNDGYGWCECEPCRALDSEDDRETGHVNRRVALFIETVCEAMKESHPRLVIGHYSYSNFSDFHLYLKAPPSNLLVSATTFRCYSHAIDDAGCPHNRPLWERIEGLRRHLEHVYIYDYLFYRWHGLPQANWRVVEADIAAYERLGIRGYLTEAPPPTAEKYGSAHLVLYIIARLLQDRRQTASQLLEDYCAHRFGPAAEAMRRYFDALADGVAAMEGCLKRAGDSFERSFTPEVIARAGAALAEAARIVDDRSSEALKEERERFEGWIALRETRSRNACPSQIAAAPLKEGVFHLPPEERRASSLLFLDYTLKVPPASSQTWANAYADEGNIAFVIECEEEAMEHAQTRPGCDAGAVYGSESVEIFILDGKDPELCYHFLVSIAGGHAASECSGTRWNWSWQGGQTVHVERLEDRWRVFFSVPRKNVGLEAGKECRFTLARNRRNLTQGMSGVPNGGVFFQTNEYLAMTLP